MADECEQRLFFSVKDRRNRSVHYTSIFHGERMGCSI